MRDRHEHKREQKEVERVERPAEKTGNEAVALSAIERFEESQRLHGSDLIVDLALVKRGCAVAAAVLTGNAVLNCAVRYLVKAKLKSGKTQPLLNAIERETLGKRSIAGEEYVYDMQQARINNEGVARWVETCFCDPPLAEERPYWEEYFELLSVKDAHSRRNCRHENGTEAWACCDCDCTRKLEERLRSKGESF